MNCKLILTIGASCSGKTTWAEQQEGYHNINRDDVRFEMFTNGVRDWTRYRFSNKNEREVTNQCEELALIAAAYGANIIISDTNLNPEIRNKWKEFASTYGYDYEEKLFPCDWDELVKRNNQRDSGISEAILYSQYKRFIQQYGDIGGHKLEVYKHDPQLMSTMIVDIDGTIADMDGVRKPYEWDKVGQDKVRQVVVDMVMGLAHYTQHITFMSGRDGVSYYDTLEWLQRYVMTHSTKHIEWDLVMRETGDMRKDYIVKYELFNTHVRGKFNVDAVFDDRDQVLRLWDLLDLPNVVNVGGYQNKF